MKNNNMTTFIIVAGVLILIIFSVTLSINLLPNYESNSYFAKPSDNMIAKIENITVENGIMTITTSGNPTYYCAKVTRTTPKQNSLCWKEIKNNKVSVSIFEYKKYYIWLKDENDNISNYTSLNLY